MFVSFDIKIISKKHEMQNGQAPRLLNCFHPQLSWAVEHEIYHAHKC